MSKPSFEHVFLSLSKESRHHCLFQCNHILLPVMDNSKCMFLLILPINYYNRSRGITLIWKAYGRNLIVPKYHYRTTGCLTIQVFVSVYFRQFTRFSPEIICEITWGVGMVYIGLMSTINGLEQTINKFILWTKVLDIPTGKR